MRTILSVVLSLLMILTINSNYYNVYVYADNVSYKFGDTRLPQSDDIKSAESVSEDNICFLVKYPAGTKTIQCYCENDFDGEPIEEIYAHYIDDAPIATSKTIDELVEEEIVQDGWLTMDLESGLYDIKYFSEVEEKDWLNTYHAEVYEKIAPHLNDEEQLWLKKATSHIYPLTSSFYTATVPAN